MRLVKRTRVIVFGIAVFLLGVILACASEATPTAAPPQMDAAAIQRAVEQALAAQGSQRDIRQAVEEAMEAQPQPPQGPSADDIAMQVEAAVQAAVPEGTSAQEIQGMVEAAVSAAVAATAQGAVTSTQVQQAISEALAAQQPGVTAEELEVAITAAMAAVPTPAAMPVSTAMPAGMVEPSGSLSVGISILLGSAEFNLTNQGITQSRFDSVFTHDDMWVSTPDGANQGRLVREWEVDPTGRVFTFRIQEGAMFSGGWGEFTADDLLFSIEQVSSEESFHSVKGATRRLFTCDACGLVKIDTYTVQLTRPTATAGITWNNESHLNMQSKRHFDTVGKEQANRESVGTNSWELVDFRQDSYRRLNARPGHWAKTPNFNELTVWELQEESTRLANFLTGIIDTGSFTPDTIDAIRGEGDPSIDYMRLPGGEFIYLPIYGMQHHLDHPDHLPNAEGTVNVALADSAADCDLPWVSCNHDLNSGEWANAQKVRQALAIAIDREKLVNNLAGGDGEPLYLLHWTGHERLAQELGLDTLEYEYDPVQARQLLADAGFPDGIDFDMTLTEFASAGPIAAGEAVATMWQEIGARAQLNRVPYSAWRPCTVDRSCKAIATHNNQAWVEPMRIFPVFYHPSNAFNLGFEHPFMTDLLDRMSATADWETRKQLNGELARFTFDQVLAIPLYTRKVIWPLGEKLDPWGIQARQAPFLSNWEFAPHGT